MLNIVLKVLTLMLVYAIIVVIVGGIVKLILKIHRWDEKHNYDFWTNYELERKEIVIRAGIILLAILGVLITTMLKTI